MRESILLLRLQIIILKFHFQIVLATFLILLTIFIGMISGMSTALRGQVLPSACSDSVDNDGDTFVDVTGGGLGRLDALTLASGEDILRSSPLLDPTGNFAYVGTSTMPGKVVKVRLPDLTAEATLNLQFGEDNIVSAVIDRTNGFAYVATGTSPAKIVKINLSNFTHAGSITLNPGEEDLQAAAMDETAGFAYFGSFGSPGTIVKIDLNTFAHAGALTLSGGNEFVSSAVIDSDEGYGYFSLYTTPGKIVKVNLSSFTEESTLTLQTDENQPGSIAIDRVHNMLYAATRDSAGDPGELVKIDLTTFTETASTPVDIPSDGRFTISVDTVQEFAYMGTSESPARVLKVHLPSMTLVGTVTLNAGEENAVSSMLTSENNQAALYVGTNTVPGKVVKVGPLGPDTGCENAGDGDERGPALQVLSPLEGAEVPSGDTAVQYQIVGDLLNADHVHYRLDLGQEERDLDGDGMITLTGLAEGPHDLEMWVARADHTLFPNTEATTHVAFTSAVVHAAAGNAPLCINLLGPAGPIQVTTGTAQNIALERFPDDRFIIAYTGFNGTPSIRVGRAEKDGNLFWDMGEQVLGQGSGTDTQIAVIDADTFVVTMNGSVRAGTVNGGTITWGSPMAFGTGTDTVLTALDSSTFAIAYRNATNPSGSGEGFARIGIVNGEEISWATAESTFTGAVDAALDIAITKIDGQRFLVSYIEENSTQVQGESPRLFGFFDLLRTEEAHAQMQSNRLIVTVGTPEGGVINFAGLPVPNSLPGGGTVESIQTLDQLDPTHFMLVYIATPFSQPGTTYLLSSEVILDAGGTLSFGGGFSSSAAGPSDGAVLSGISYPGNYVLGTDIGSVVTFTPPLQIGSIPAPGSEIALVGLQRRFIIAYGNSIAASYCPGCSNGVDDDADVFIDSADPGCHTDADPTISSSYDPNDNDETDPQCSDTLDNDTDGAVDTLDPGCHTDGNAGNAASYRRTDNSETDALPECSDRLDNDRDARIDSADAGCHSDGNAFNAASYTPLDDNEAATCGNFIVEVSEQCDDGNTASGDGCSDLCIIEPNPCRDTLDDDADGKADYPADLGCLKFFAPNEWQDSECFDGIDNDADGAIDGQDFSCIILFNGESRPRARCQDGIDNDLDGAADIADTGCTSAQDHSER